MTVPEALDALEAFYGAQSPDWPVDPYLFIVWWHCGYPASDKACAKGWAAMQKIGTEPEQLLKADPKTLATALKAGGMVPELRAMRLKEIAHRALAGFRVTRAELKKFSNIADAGADRILLFAGKEPVAAVPSNCPQVLVRLVKGREGLNYPANYRMAQEAIESGVAPTFDARTRAYLLLKKLGQEYCKRTNPKCGACPVRGLCPFPEKNPPKNVEKRSAAPT